MPSFPCNRNGLFGPPGWQRQRRRQFRPSPTGAKNYSLMGVARDGSGGSIASCTVDLFNAGDNSWVARTTSDGAGAFAFIGIGPGPFFARAVDAGGTVVGATLGTLVAV